MNWKHRQRELAKHLTECVQARRARLWRSVRLADVALLDAAEIDGTDDGDGWLPEPPSRGGNQDE